MRKHLLRSIPGLAWVVVLISSPDTSASSLFPLTLENDKWIQFGCEGYSQKVSGVIFKAERPPVCGVPLGGVGTGCLDIEAGGVLGFETLFNQQPRSPQLLTPFLGMAVDGKTYVLAARKYVDGGRIQGAFEPNCGGNAAAWSSDLIHLEGVEPAEDIHYFGHYPVVDLEYVTNAPIKAGLRAWSPFIPGDIGASNIPAAVFEVHLRNESPNGKKGTLAFSFPGLPPIADLHDSVPITPEAIMASPVCNPNPAQLVAGDKTYERKEIQEPLKGVSVVGPYQIGYLLGTIGEADVRTGCELSGDGAAWSKISEILPAHDIKRSGSSIAVNFDLEAGKEKTIRFVLSWYSPILKADPVRNVYTNYYALRYKDAAEVAGRMVKEHESLLKRILQWQEVIYSDEGLPMFLRDCLINNLCLIPETTFWLAPKDPLGDWCYPDGYFAMNESPRGCSHIECIPCTWYGNMPINYFFPQLARTTLRAYKLFQREDGAIPFELGPCCNNIGFITPSHNWQKGLNSMCYVDLVDRLWLCTGDPTVVSEFFDAVKKATIYTVEMSTGPDRVISIPDDVRSEWWEGFDWFGMTAHAGALRISCMDMAARMAEIVGDKEFAAQASLWREEGVNSMENKMWNDGVGSYMLYKHEVLKKENDTIMSNQFDGEWNNDFHGLPGIYRKERLDRALGVIKKSCLCHFGAVSFAKPDLTPLVTYGIFPPEIMMLGFTYMYENDRETGLKVLEDCMQNLVIKYGAGWDMPNMVSGAPTFTEAAEEGREGFVTFGEGVGDGAPKFGTDYYQNMMLWSAPAALMNTDMRGPVAKDGLVSKMISAGKRN